MYVRWLVFLLLLVPAMAVAARPTVAVAPMSGDDGGRIGNVVASVAKKSAKVSRPDNLGLTTGTAKKLRAKLDVDVLVFGDVGGRGKERRLSLTIVGRSSTSKLVVEFGSQKELRDELEDKLGKRIKSAAGDGDEEDDEREARAKKQREDDEREARAKKRREDDEREARAKKRREDDEREARANKSREEDEREARAKKRSDDDRRGKRGDDDDRRASRNDDKRGEDKRRGKRGSRDDDRNDDDDRRGKRRTADRGDDLDEDDLRDDGEDDRPRRKKRRGEAPERHALTHAALWLDAGGVVARRTLTYVGTGMMQPPRVGTAAPAGRLAVELYPAAFSSLKGAAAGFGLAAGFDRTFGLGIAVPNTNVTTPISNGHYSVGFRYRFITGGTSIAAGIDYWKRHYVADRSGLMDPALLDMPDVDYTAVAPTITARFALSPKLAAYGGFEFPLMLNSGPIQETSSYGSARILAFGLRAGVQIGLGEHYAVQIGLDFDQVGLKFTQKPGSMSEARQVQSATDRSVGLAATIGVMY